MTTPITKEQLIEKLKHRISVTEKYPDVEEAQLDATICKLALAAMDAEPVGYYRKGSDGFYFASPTEQRPGTIPLYAAPPAPVVPVVPDEASFWDWLRDEMPTTYRWARELEDTPENSALITKGKASALDMLSAWKGCSAAMLQPEPVSETYKLNSPVIPDGWVIVPKDPTDEMIVAAMDSDDVTYNDSDDTVFYVHHREIYKAMLAAAPKEVG